MGKLIEGVWDCQYCEAKKIRGSIRVCPVCGRQRDNNIKFYLDDPHNYVDEETAKKINKNPDWLCSYCDALNSDDVHTCHICGASREDGEKNYFERQAEIEKRKAEQEKRIKAMSDSKGKNDDTDLAQIYRDDGPHEPELKFKRNDCFYTKSLSSFNWRNIFKVGAGVLAAIILVMCLVWMFTPKVQDVTIQDFSWERSINIEEYVTVERNGWSLPADGRLKYSQQEIKGYEQVIDHYETKTREYTEQVLDHYETYVSGHRDLGNGYFEEIESERPVYRTETRTETYQEPVYRDEPIYATKYYYEIDVWQHAFYSTSSGNDKDPYWKEVELEELQRENGRGETYYITVVDDEDESNKYKFDFDTWNELEVGETVTIKTNVFGDAELVVDGEVVSSNN